MSLEEFLAEHDFELIQRGRDGSNRYVRHAHPYLDLWVTWFADGTIEYTWELEFGAYLIAKGFAVSVQDELSLLLFPGAERRGPAQADWLAAEVARTERELGSVDLLSGG